MPLKTLTHKKDVEYALEALLGKESGNMGQWVFHTDPFRALLRGS